MLLLVILGALALASLTVSVVYRLGRARRVVRVSRAQARHPAIGRCCSPPAMGGYAQKISPFRRCRPSFRFRAA